MEFTIFLYYIFNNVIFIVMNKKSRHIRIRITEDQFKKLSYSLIQEQMTKSSLIREVLNDYLEKNCRDTDTKVEIEISKIIEDTTHSNPNKMKI